MWRTRAVVDLLLRDVCGLPEEADRAPRELLLRARRRARLVAVVDVAALSVLFALRERTGTFLSFAGTEAVFTLGVLAVAVHAGFRLAQAESLGAVARACAELEAREPEP